MTASFTPAAAAEFPNDNPALHRGVRWVGAGPGPARAVWRAQPLETAETLETLERSQPPAAPSSPPPRVVRCCDGPLELDLGRIVLLNRVEDVPPPPDFIYRPFISSRARPAPLAPSPRPIHPRPCRVVDARRGIVVACAAPHLPAELQAASA